MSTANDRLLSFFTEDRRFHMAAFADLTTPEAVARHRLSTRLSARLSALVGGVGARRLLLTPGIVVVIVVVAAVVAVTAVGGAAPGRRLLRRLALDWCAIAFVIRRVSAVTGNLDAGVAFNARSAITDERTNACLLFPHSVEAIEAR